PFLHWLPICSTIPFTKALSQRKRRTPNVFSGFTQALICSHLSPRSNMKIHVFQPCKPLLTAFFLLGLVFTASSVKADTINFDDGVADDAVGSFYTAQGVTFLNATFDSFGGLNGGSAPLSIRSTVDDYYPTAANPIAAIFSLAQASVSLTGLD